jgi:hypothetical protein
MAKPKKRQIVGYWITVEWNDGIFEDVDYKSKALDGFLDELEDETDIQYTVILEK